MAKRFAVLSFDLTDAEAVEGCKNDLEQALKSIGGTDILFSVSDTFVSASSTLTGAAAEEDAQQQVQRVLVRAVRNHGAQNVLYTGSPEEEPTRSR